jgi:hypothetical protein
MSSPSRRQAVDCADVQALRGARLRTGAIRIVLASASIALVAAAAASARGLDVTERGFLPRGSTGVVVLDQSLSIAETSYPDVRRTLRDVIRTDAPVGLVVFSDIPYELLPPGTPARELKPVLRLLQPPGSRSPVNPWRQTFRAGTRISAALELARAMLVRDHVKDGYIVLLSDLETAPDDVQVLTRTLQGLQRQGIRLRVVPLGASSDGVRIFKGVLGKDVFAALPVPGRIERVRKTATVSDVPTALLVLGCALFAALALHELLAGRLALPRPARGAR